MKINLRQLEAFRAFMITGTVSKAGEIMHITQPAVSRLLADFEYATQFKLFDRDRRRLSPTRDCEVLYREVERTFAGLDHIERTAESIREMKSGHLSVAAMPIFMTSFLPEVISRFSDKFPDVTVSLWSWSREAAIEWVLSRQHDLAFVTLPIDDKALKVEPFPADEAVCMLPCGHRLVQKDTIEIQDLEGENFIALSPGILFRQVLNEVFRQHEVRINIRVEVPHSHMASKLVAMGVGVSVLGSQGLGVRGHPDIAIRPIRPRIPYQLGIVYPKQRSMSGAARQFVDVALDAYRPMTSG